LMHCKHLYRRERGKYAYLIEPIVPGRSRIRSLSQQSGWTPTGNDAIEFV
jgi:hypothetical protein